MVRLEVLPAIVLLGDGWGWWKGGRGGSHGTARYQGTTSFHPGLIPESCSTVSGLLVRDSMSSKMPCHPARRILAVRAFVISCLTINPACLAGPTRRCHGVSGGVPVRRAWQKPTLERLAGFQSS